MSKFHRLTNNESDFPHIGNVDVYQYDNDFDYSRFDARQMTLQVCTVPWDMGEVHIGARTISGIGNVVFFDTPEKRDEWFAAIPDDECYRFETKYKELHRDHVIDVPIPYDTVARHNYLVVHYEPFANDNSLVEYASKDGKNDWFWFIREVEFVAPNTTRLHLLEDAWQTWIYDVDITGMMLERGHAPMSLVDADEYLQYPIGRNKHLVCNDVNFGNDYIAKSSSEVIFNAGNMYALIITSADVTSSWGTKSNSDWHTPGYENFQLQGLPSYFAFAIEAPNLSAFLSNVKTSVPQFVQTIKAIAFVSADLLTFTEDGFLFADVTCRRVSANYKSNELLKIDKDMFSYPARYREIAKLYTYPYAYILVTDEMGNQTEVRIENTNGTINVESTVSLVFPWLTINAHLSGIGKSNAKSVRFANVTDRTMPIQGNWFDTLMSWNIPTFGIIQDAETNNDYATFYDRKQQQTAIDNQYLNVVENADTVVDNADLTASTNTAITTASNLSVAGDSALQQLYNSAICATDDYATMNSATATTAANEQQATIAAASGVATGVMGAIGSAASGNPLGAIGSLAGAAIGAAATMSSSSVSIALTNAQATIAKTANDGHATAANDLSADKSTIHQAAQTAIAGIQNDLTTGSAANTSAAMLANGARDKSTGESAIANQVAQAAMGQPSEFGAFDNGDLASSRPMGLFANIVTQSDAAIMRAGDEFLRYGYMYDAQWDFDGNWNVGKYFTYWKLKDFWVTNLNVPDMYMDKLRFFLFGGVTVWRDPTDIGKRTVYENFN